MEKAAKSYRYERKFVVAELSPPEIRSLVRLHPSLFYEPYPPRCVNNIYYDSLDMASYFGNLDGTAHRVKVRIRWYGDLLGHIDKPTLELKIKHGLVGDKESYPLAAFCLTENGAWPDPAELTDPATVPPALRNRLLSLRPSLLNRYHRRYYQSADRRFRLTIDDCLDYYAVNSRANTFSRSWRDHRNCVVELKYDPSHAPLAAQIINAFPFRLSRNSKYINGVERMRA